MKLGSVSVGMAVLQDWANDPVVAICTHVCKHVLAILSTQEKQLFDWSGRWTPLSKATALAEGRSSATPIIYSCRATAGCVGQRYPPTVPAHRAGQKPPPVVLRRCAAQWWPPAAFTRCGGQRFPMLHRSRETSPYAPPCWSISIENSFQVEKFLHIY